MSVSRAIAGLEAAVGGEHEAIAGMLAEGLSRVEERFDRQLRSDLPPVRDLVEHVERYRGKMLRPVMTLLCGLAQKGPGATAADLTEAHITVGAVVEMIHVATLVHDDVLDEAETRRRAQTVNNLRGNEVAVILGDYLISSAFHLCSGLANQDIALLIGGVTTRLCEGELLQLHHRDDFSLDEATYFEIVQRKTAELIGAACELGAGCSGAAPATRQRLRDFGMKLGVAFQIQDDLLDLTGEERVVGKSVGKDLEKGKLTLPLIHHLGRADAIERGRTLRLIGAGAPDDRHVDVDARAVRAALEKTGSVDFARASAQRLVREARSLLSDTLPASPAADLLHAVADAVVTRAF